MIALNLGFLTRRWIHLVLLVIPGFPMNAEKFTKAKSLDLLPDPQHFTNSMKAKAAKWKSPALKCLTFSLCLKSADLNY